VTVVSLSSVRGAPGVTSLSILLAAAWPLETHERRVVLEADLSGGVLAARYGLGIEPGLATLAAAARGHGDLPIDECGRHIAPQVWCIPAPAAAESARLIWGSSARELAHRMTQSADLWILDAGRIDVDGPLAAVARAVDRHVVVTSSGFDAVVAVPSRVAALAAASTAPVSVVVVGKPSHGLEELRTFFGVTQVWVTPPTNQIVEATHNALTKKSGRRSLWWRSAVEIAAGLVPAPQAPSYGGSDDTGREADAITSPDDTRRDQQPLLGELS
jgi:MinD-like ATPase involved in chromosome partitioning or flagellar assembly